MVRESNMNPALNWAAQRGLVTKFREKAFLRERENTRTDDLKEPTLATKYIHYKPAVPDIGWVGGQSGGGVLQDHHFHHPLLLDGRLHLHRSVLRSWSAVLTI
jgi:hypothetical protein